MSSKKQSKSSALISFFGVVAIIILINIAATFFTKRIDLTEDGRYSLSENTIALLKDENRLTDRIFFKIYLEGDLPADMKIIQNGIQNILDEFISIAGDKIQYEFIDPNGSDDITYNNEFKEKILDNGKGVHYTLMRSFDGEKIEEIEIWPGATVEYNGTTVDVIRFFKRKEIVMDENLNELVDKTISDLEFKFITSIRRITRKQTKKIGFLQGHGELTPAQTGDIRYYLGKDYTVDDIEIKGKLNAFDDVDALIVAKPTQPFNEKDKFVIDQYIMKGGKVLWFIDPINMSTDSLAKLGETWGTSYNLNIEKDLIYKYGARLNNDIVFDKECTHEFIFPDHVNLPGTEWGYYPLVSTNKHPITINLDPIKTVYTSSVEPVNLKDTAVTKTILLSSSSESKAILAPVRVNYGHVKPQFAPDVSNVKYANNPIAVLLEGRFSSPFENRISDAFLQGAKFDIRYKSVPNKMLVVSDGDIINNTFITYLNRKKQVGMISLNQDRFGVKTLNGTPKFNFGNREFVLNAVDYLMDDNSLIGIRSKSITLRMLDDDKVKEEKTFWKNINIYLPILFIISLAIIQLFIRKRKYTK